MQRSWLECLSSVQGLTINRPYERYPDWRIDVEREQALLMAHERIVFMYPLYWYSVPPLMKLWMDEVLTFGWAYGPGVDRLKGKTWLQAISTGAVAQDYQAGGFNEFSLSELLKPVQRTAHMLGMRYRPPFVLHGVRQQDEQALQRSAQSLLDELQAEAEPQFL